MDLSPGPSCPCCADGGFVAAGDEHVPCPACCAAAHGQLAARRSPAAEERPRKLVATRLTEPSVLR